MRTYYSEREYVARTGINSLDSIEVNSIKTETFALMPA